MLGEDTLFELFCEVRDEGVQTIRLMQSYDRQRIYGLGECLAEHAGPEVLRVWVENEGNKLKGWFRGKEAESAE